MKLISLIIAFTAAAPWATAADGDSIDSTVKAVYDVISGPVGPRDWNRFRALFADGALLVPVRTTPEGSKAILLSVEDFVKRSTAASEKSAFYESEVSQRVETFGNIAHVFSTYESRRAPGDKPFARGINSMQLVRTGNTWKFLTILWDTEREGNPLPEKYLR